MTISKRKFGEVCGVSMTTVYKWIDHNKGGILDFVTAEGIETAIFDREPWKQRKATAERKRAEKQQAGGAVDQAGRASDRGADRAGTDEETTQELRAQLNALKTEYDRIAEENTRLRAEVDTLTERMAYKQSEIEREREISAQLRQIAADFKQLAERAQMLQLAGLPEPRRNLLKEWKDGIVRAFTRKDKQTVTADEQAE